MNALAIAVGIMLTTDHKLMRSHIEKVQNWITKEGPWLNAKLKSLNGIIAHPSCANFQLIESDLSLIHLREKLSQKKILVRDCRSFVGLDDKWLRISLKAKAENLRIFNSIKKILN